MHHFDAEGRLATMSNDRALSSTVTVVLRLLAGPLADGELVGHGEVVATGARSDIRGAQDVIRLAGGPTTHFQEGPQAPHILDGAAGPSEPLPAQRMAAPDPKPTDP